MLDSESPVSFKEDSSHFSFEALEGKEEHVSAGTQAQGTSAASEWVEGTCVQGQKGTSWMCHLTPCL